MVTTGGFLTSETLSCWSEAGRGVVVVKCITVVLLRLSLVLCYQIQNGHTWEKSTKAHQEIPLKTFSWPFDQSQRMSTITSRPMNVTATPMRSLKQVSNNSYQTSNVLSQSLKGGWQLPMQGRQMSISRCWISSQVGQILKQYVVCKIFLIECKLCDLCRHNFLFHYCARLATKILNVLSTKTMQMKRP